MDDPRATIHSLVRRNLGPAQPVKAAPALEEPEEAKNPVEQPLFGTGG